MGKKRRYITGLDGIRAIAVIMVLAYHLKLALFKSGFLGVTVFFVLSGYLITGILISEVEEEGTIDLKNFWLRRIRRLVPAVIKSQNRCQEILTALCKNNPVYDCADKYDNNCH